jgi:hypothetical protein
LIDLFLLEGYSAGFITIPYSSLIVFGAWLGFANKVKLSKAKWSKVKQSKVKWKGARGRGEV